MSLAAAIDLDLREAFMAGVKHGRSAPSKPFWEEVEAEEAAYLEWKKT